jgi:hypothetical protein
MYCASVSDLVYLCTIHPIPPFVTSTKLLSHIALKWSHLSKCYFDLSFNISKGEVHESSGEVNESSGKVQEISGEVQNDLWGGAHLPSPPLKIQP